MSGVKAGIMLSAQYFEGADMVSALQDSLLMVRLARDRGWDSYFCGQHYLNEGGNQGLQMVPYLARLAADAGDMALGIGLLLAPLHNPVYRVDGVSNVVKVARCPPRTSMTAWQAQPTSSRNASPRPQTYG